MLFSTRRKRATKKRLSTDKALNVEKLVRDSNQIIIDELVAHLSWDAAQSLITNGIANITAAHLLPAIVCLACGGTYDTAIQIQAGWTLLSYGIKVHDDLIDGDPKTNTLSAHEYLALGVIIMDLAYIAIDMATVSNRQYRAIVSEIALAKTELMLAQAEKISVDTSTETYFAHILRKSGNYFSSACKVGAIAANLSEKQAPFSTFARLGLTIGMAIQIGDDIMDVASDLRKQHFTLPVLLAVQDGDTELLQLCQSPILTDETHSEILRRIEDATTGANKLRNVYVAQSRQCLAELESYISDDAINLLHSVL